MIGPMLLMSLHRTLTTSLITSSVATVLFTLVLALGARNLKGQEFWEQLLRMRLCWLYSLGRVYLLSRRRIMIENQGSIVQLLVCALACQLEYEEGRIILSLTRQRDNVLFQTSFLSCRPDDRMIEA